MALTRVQSNIANGAGLAPSVDIGSVPAAGDLVVVSITSYDGTRTISLAGFTLIPTDGEVTNTVKHAVFYKIADGAGGTDVITGAVSGTTSVGWRIIAVQYHDSTAGSTWHLDRSAHASGSNNAPNSGTTLLTTDANEVWVGVLSSRIVRTQSSPTNGFSLVQGGSTSPPSYLYEKIVAATGTANVAATMSGTSAWVGTTATFYSAGPATPANTVAPVASGTTTVGQTVSVTHGTWTLTPTGYVYQWQRDSHGSGGYSNILGATSSSYLLVDADDACHVRCQVTGVNASGAGAPAASNAIGPAVEPPPLFVSAPVATGTLVPRGRLFTSGGTWTHMGGFQPEFAYQWQSSSDGVSGWADVPGATHNVITLSTADIGKYFRCQVDAGNTGQPL